MGSETPSPIYRQLFPAQEPLLLAMLPLVAVTLLLTIQAAAVPHGSGKTVALPRIAMVSKAIAALGRDAERLLSLKPPNGAGRPIAALAVAVGLMVVVELAVKTSERILAIGLGRRVAIGSGKEDNKPGRGLIGPLGFLEL